MNVKWRRHLYVATALTAMGMGMACHNGDQDNWQWVKEHCTNSHPCYNGNVPSYSNPNCWPGAIWCPLTGDSIVKVTRETVDGYNYECDHFENGAIKCRDEV